MCFLYLQQRPLILLLSGNCHKCDWPRLLPAATKCDHRWGVGGLSSHTVCLEKTPGECFVIYM